MKNRATLALRMRKRYFRRSTSKKRLVGEVHRHHVAEEAVEVEDVEGELAVGTPPLVREHQVDVVIEVAPVLRRPARQPQVDVVGIVDLFVAAIAAAVDVEHRGVHL